jgi:hypothetical protein
MCYRWKMNFVVEETQTTEQVIVKKISLRRKQKNTRKYTIKYDKYKLNFIDCHM